MMMIVMTMVFLRLPITAMLPVLEGRAGLTYAVRAAEEATVE